MDVVTKLRKFFLRKPRVQDVHIALEPEGFSMRGNIVCWADVTQVVAYKLDLGTTDTVRIRLTLNSGGVLEADEEQPGFGGFMAALEAQFPSANGWRAKVLQPAFARNETLLYGRT